MMASTNDGGRQARRISPEPDQIDSVFNPSKTKGDPEFRNSFLLLPKEEPDDSSDAPFTFSAAAAARSTHERPLQLRQPKRSPAAVLSDMGLVDVEKVSSAGIPESRDLTRLGKGIFTNQSALGMAAAYFRSEKEIGEARKALKSEFDFVPNFPIMLSARVRMDHVAATRGMTALGSREWPPASGVEAAHKAGVRGAGVLVGVLDTGVDADHDEFSHMTLPFRYVPIFPKDVPPRDIRGFDTQGHGTHVCGILAGKSVGVAPEVNLSVASVIESETTRTSLIRLTYGLEWIMRQFSRLHVDQFPAVLSMSLGFPPDPPGVAPEEFQRWLRVMRTILRTLVKSNVLPVVAIGNEGPGSFRYPGALPDVLGVGAVDYQGKIATFSGSAAQPPKPDLVGYGVGVYSGVERDYAGRSVYQRFNGTSMATPYVAGIASLYRCRQPNRTVHEIIQLMKDSALPLSEPPELVGAGLARFA
jgi:subtilisin family serine protease